ncbi:hypothetical protein J5Y09_04385 [Roseomonas sp. PWR1]|uniref:Uncharacterized protein n=1 Tax=Roseomonas nitratireducens TaxID=2820810 RepID=A0ABS4AQK2_9PROT|nr:hypothetical protein [Neoroseomonas nitratireducens]MBP0463138.1 hypothetical protein [Neoroseomonas nitratireducens]
MTEPTPTPDPRDEALNMLALLCGQMMRAMRKSGVMGEGDVEAILAAMENAKPSPLVTHLLDQVRWAAEWKAKPPG